MPRVTFVKKAQKDNPVAKKGESYYWWAFMIGGRGGPKRFSKTPPKPSQLTQSEFLSTVLSIGEDAENAPDFDSIESERDDIVGKLQELADETRGKYDNMPDGLQQGDTGQQLESRADSVESSISDLEGIDVSLDEPDKDDKESDEEFETRISELKDQRAEEIWQEVRDAISNIES